MTSISLRSFLLITAAVISCLAFALWLRSPQNPSETPSLISSSEPVFPKSTPETNPPFSPLTHSPGHPQNPSTNPSSHPANPISQDVQPAKTTSTNPPGKNTSDYTLKTASPAGTPLPAPVTTENFVVQSYKILVPDSAPNPASPDQSPQNPQNTEEIVLNVPPGMPAPVVFLDTNSYSPQIQRKLYEIAKEFETNVSTPIEGISPQELWSFALSLADKQYIKILGFEAYNYLHLEARREALREKRLMEKSPPPPDPNTPTN